VNLAAFPRKGRGRRRDRHDELDAKQKKKLDLKKKRRVTTGRSGPRLDEKKEARGRGSTLPRETERLKKKGKENDG